MTVVGLFFVGSVLLVNGLGLLGVLPARAGAPLNALIGVLLAGVALAGMLPAGADAPERLIGPAGFLLFAITYLLVAVVGWTGQPGTVLGWYCGWAAVVSVFLSLLNFGRLGDARFGVVWLAWAVLFAMFFVVLALGNDRAGYATGWLTIGQSITTTSVPGALELAGLWNDTPVPVVALMQLVPIALLAYFLATGARRDPRSDSGQAARPEPGLRPAEEASR